MHSRKGAGSMRESWRSGNRIAAIVRMRDRRDFERVTVILSKREDYPANTIDSTRLRGVPVSGPAARERVPIATFNGGPALLFPQQAQLSRSVHHGPARVDQDGGGRHLTGRTSRMSRAENGDGRDRLSSHIASDVRLRLHERTISPTGADARQAGNIAPSLRVSRTPLLDPARALRDAPTLS